MQTYRVETKIEETGRLSLSQLPFRVGEEVEVVVRRRRGAESGPQAPGEPARNGRGSDLPPESDREVVVADRGTRRAVRVFSPRLAHPEDASDFKKQVVELSGNAEI